MCEMTVPFPDAAHLTPKELGKVGEQVACVALEELGWQLIGRNVRVSHDEMDAIFLHPDGSTLVVVEVKTRTTSDFGSGIESITPTKVKRLRRAIVGWLQYNENYYPQIRIDCIEAAVDPGGSGFILSHYPEVG